MGSQVIFFSSWSHLGRIVIIGVCAYAALVLCLRVSGKRTLSKMNAFDLVVTVALGSTLSTILLSRDTALADGVLALALLIALQYVVAWVSVRSPQFEATVKSRPSLLLYRGRVDDEALRANRISHEELRAAVRAGGLVDLEKAGAVVLETDGSFSVIPGEHVDGSRPLEGLS